MIKLIDVVRDAEAKKKAVGHFNFSELTALNAMFAAARELGVPIIAGVSEGERDYVGVREAAALVKSLREEFSYPIFLNADHTYSIERVEEAVRAGYDAVIFDGAKLPFDENLAKTKECVARVKAINPNVLVEAELGYIGTSSKLLDAIPDGAEITAENLTKPGDAARFVKETGIDLFAPAVGNLHGMLKNVPNPRLDISRIAAIREAAGVPLVLHGFTKERDEPDYDRLAKIAKNVSIPLVLHGGSGISNDDFRAAIKAGISIIHINTEIRIAFRKGIEEGLENRPDEIAPYKFLENPRRAVKEVIKNRLLLFNE